MEYLLIGIIGIMFGIIFVLLIKIQLLQKSIKEIKEAFQDRLATDTNTLNDISSRDPYLLKLATDINDQLRILREERHRYQQGDHKLKEAITNYEPVPRPADTPYGNQRVSGPVGSRGKE